MVFIKRQRQQLKTADSVRLLLLGVPLLLLLILVAQQLVWSSRILESLLSGFYPFEATTTSQKNLHQRTRERLAALLNQHRHSHHAVIVPYRGRPLHREHYLKHMLEYVQKNFPMETFSFWLVEQDDDDLFYKSWLINIALQEITNTLQLVANKHSDDTLQSLAQSTCVAMNDIDLVPIVEQVPYTTCRLPTQLSSELEDFQWGPAYPANFGGVLSMSLQHWRTLNGMSNVYHGWCCEDDNLFDRVRTCGLNKTATEPDRPLPGHGRFGKLLATEHKAHVSHRTHFNRQRNTLHMYRAWRETDCHELTAGDGLDALYYQLTDFRVEYGGSITSPVISIKATTQKAQQEYQYRHPIPELVSIPHTVDDDYALERAAAAHNISWGACHYIYHIHNIQRGSLNCPVPPANWEGHYATNIEHDHIPPWQIPPRNFVNHGGYQNRTTFAIVRNPYERVLARFVENPLGSRPRTPREWDRSAMNDFVRNRILAASASYDSGQDHVPPQYVFLYAKQEANVSESEQPPARIVDHILRYESLSQDFALLVERYKLPIELDQVDSFSKKPERSPSLNDWQDPGGFGDWVIPFMQSKIHSAYPDMTPPSKKDVNSTAIEDKFTIADLDPDVVGRIQEIYAKDFELLNYPKTIS